MAGDRTDGQFIPTRATTDCPDWISRREGSPARSECESNGVGPEIQARPDVLGKLSGIPRAEVGQSKISAHLLGTCLWYLGGRIALLQGKST